MDRSLLQQADAPAFAEDLGPQDPFSEGAGGPSAEPWAAAPEPAAQEEPPLVDPTEQEEPDLLRGKCTNHSELLRGETRARRFVAWVSRAVAGEPLDTEAAPLGGR